MQRERERERERENTRERGEGGERQRERERKREKERERESKRDFFTQFVTTKAAYRIRNSMPWGGGAGGGFAVVVWCSV